MKIVSDVDECVVEYVEGFCNFWNNKTGDNLRHSDFEYFSFRETLGIGRRGSHKLRNEYMRSEFFDNMKFIDGAREGILKLVENNHIDFVTAREDSDKYKTREFFDREFPEHSFDIYFERGSKLDRIRKLGADVIIEDNPGSLKYAMAGFKVLLFDRKWNRGLEHENIIRCYNWAEVVGNV